MTGNRISRAAIIWFVIVVLAVINGLVRDTIVAPQLGAGFALPLSGITLSVAVFAVTWFGFGFLRAESGSACFLVGVQWVLMTLIFEWVFGRLVGGKSWQDLLLGFDVTTGNLFILVLLVALLSPTMVARIKGVLK